MKHDGQAEAAFAFGRFLFDPHRRQLLRADTPVPLGSRARDILLLLRRAGETVPKREVLRQVWPSTVVEEGSLRVQVAALRKALEEGEDGATRYVENVTGVGYRFVAPVTRVSAHSPVSSHAPEPPFPAALTCMLGREQAVLIVMDGSAAAPADDDRRPGRHRKTTVAAAAAERLREAYPGGVHSIDLQSLSVGDPGLRRTLVASVPPLAIQGAAELAAGAAADSRSRHRLLVLDHCDPVIEAAAHLVERLLASVPGIHILAASREPLRARGERVMRLKPLEMPESGARLTASEALTFPAIQLFVERARASLYTFELMDEAASAVAEICRKLDGLALAIELAAARVDVLGVRALARHLDNPLELLTQGRWTAKPRHQSLRTALDWSYELLCPAEQQALRRLAVFAGGFSARAAAAVVADAAKQPSDAADILANLAAKSVLTAEATGESVCYRLLNSSRAYALEKLEGSAECATIRRRHVEWCRRWAEEETGEYAADRDAWPDGLRPGIEEARAALDWCFSPQGDPVLGLELMGCLAPLWFLLSFHVESSRSWSCEKVPVVGASARSSTGTGWRVGGAWIPSKNS